MPGLHRRRLLYLPLRLLVPGSPGRARITPALQELAASIRAVGVLQPLTVVPRGEKYIAVSGSRRLQGARLAGLKTVPCLLLEPGLAPELISLTENLQREDLHFFDQALLLRDYLQKSGLSQAAAAKVLGRSQSAVANRLRLLGLSEPLRQSLREAGLSERHARALLRVPGETARRKVLEEIIRGGFTVARTETYITRFLESGGTPGERLRRRDTRLFLQRLQRDAEDLRRSGVAAELERQEGPGELILTVRIEGALCDCIGGGDLV